MDLQSTSESNGSKGFERNDLEYQNAQSTFDFYEAGIGAKRGGSSLRAQIAIFP